MAVDNKNNRVRQTARELGDDDTLRGEGGEFIKVSKEVANFIDGGGVSDRNCGNCRFFEGGTCVRVEGVITPDDISDLYEPIRSSGHMTAEEATFSNTTVRRTMFITKVSTDEQTGVKRFFATASGVKFDKFEERMSVELFSDFIRRINDREEVPGIYASKAWNGGLPYLSVAHYLDLGGDGIAGVAEKVWIDGDILKAKGVFADTLVGNAVFESIDKDIKNNVPDNERVRISIAFLDWGHAHEGEGDFTRKSLLERCEMCDQKIKGKIYKSGQLIHLAVTRIPAYEETAIQLTERAMSTQNEDAESIVGEEEAKKLAEKNKAIVGRSDAENIDPAAIVTKKGHLDKEDEDEKDIPDDDSEEEEDEKKKKKSAKAQVDLKSLGGAKTIEGAEAYLEKHSAGLDILTPEEVLSQVVVNISKPKNETAIRKAIADYGQRFDILAVKTLAEMGNLISDTKTLGGTQVMEEVNSTVSPEGDAHPLDVFFDTFKVKYEEALATPLTGGERVKMLQKDYEDLGKGIHEVVNPTTEAGNAADMERAVQEALQPFETRFATLEVLLTQLVGAKNGESTKALKPARRSAVPSSQNIATAAVATRNINEAPVEKRSKLTQTIRASVGIPQKHY